jgi:hypothetical protein
MLSSFKETANFDPDAFTAIAVISFENDIIFFGFFELDIEKTDDLAEKKVVPSFDVKLSTSSCL